MTSEKRQPVNNGQYFWDPMVVTVHKFDCTNIFLGSHKQQNSLWDVLLSVIQTPRHTSQTFRHVTFGDTLNRNHWPYIILIPEKRRHVDFWTNICSKKIHIKILLVSHLTYLLKTHSYGTFGWTAVNLLYPHPPRASLCHGCLNQQHMPYRSMMTRH